MGKYNTIPNRSDRYQPLLLEISCSHELLDIFQEHDSIYKRLNPYHYNDEIAELEEQLKKELWRLINDNLTERQKEVVRLCASGKTQVEIAKILGVNQSSITKQIAGNSDYKHKDIKGNPTIYGGIKLKLSKIADKDPIINDILQKIAEAREENY